MRALVVISILLPQLVMAQVDFTAELSSKQVEKGERFTVILKSTKNGQISAPEFPEGLNFLGQRSGISTSVEPGKMVTVYSYNLIFQAEELGTYKLGPFSLKTSGKTFETETLTIEVKKSVKRPQGEKGELMFLAVDVSKRQVHVGEPVKVSYKLYHRYALSQYITDGGVDIKDSHKTDLTDPQKRPSWREKRIGAFNYSYATIYETMVIPQKAGKIDLGSLTAEGIVHVDFFHQYRKKVSVKGGTLTVEALPVEDGFNGAVGDLEFSYEVNDTMLKAGQPLEITVTLKGVGNLGLFEIPEPVFPSQFQRFEPVDKDKVTAGGNGFRGNVTRVFSAVPNYDGDYTIPEYVFYHFDPASDQLVRHSIPAMHVKVGKGGPVSAGTPLEGNGNPTLSKHAVETEVKDIAHIIPVEGKTLNAENTLTSKSWYWIAASSPIWGVGLCSLLLIGMRRKNDRPAKHGFQQKIKQAKQALKHSEHALCYDHLDSALRLFIQEYGLDEYAGQAATHGQLAENLAKAGIAEPLVHSLLSYLSECELAKYGGGDKANAQKMLENVESALYKATKTMEA